MREDWVECKIKDFAKLINGDRGKNYPSRQHYTSEGVPFITAGNILNGKIDINNLNFIARERFVILKSGKLVEGDIIYCLRGTLGKSAIFTKLENGAIASSLAIIRVSQFVNKEFVFNFLNSPFGKKLIEKFDNGTTQPNLSGENVSNYEIPLAPLPIQRAIVLKIENLLTSLDKGIADLKKAQEQLKVYRQAVLKKAFEGGFTREWRNNHPYTLSELLNELKKEKSEAVKTKLITKEDYFPEFSEKEMVFKIPANWICLPWKTLTSNNKYAMKRGPFGSALKKEFFVKEGYAVYEQGHAINDEPYRHRYFITQDKFKEMKAFSVKGGDMIISCSGVTLGRICLLPADADKGIINQALLKIDMDEKIMLKRYFLMLFRSELFQRLIFGKSLGTAMPNMVGMTELKQIPIPVPSINEQYQIIKEIESRLSVCDKVEQSITEALEKAEALRQSILKKAFEGKLLSDAEIAKCKQEADYEPASVLLNKIRNKKP